MFKRFNFKPMSLVKSAAFGFLGVFAYKLINQYVEKTGYRWAAYLLLLSLGISTPTAIELANVLYKDSTNA